MSDAPKSFRNPLCKSEYRNLRCLCRSGKKVKKCHGKDYAIDVHQLNEINRMIDDHNKAVKEITKAVKDAANKEKK